MKLEGRSTANRTYTDWHFEDYARLQPFGNGGIKAHRQTKPETRNSILELSESKNRVS